MITHLGPVRATFKKKIKKNEKKIYKNVDHLKPPNLKSYYVINDYKCLSCLRAVFERQDRSRLVTRLLLRGSGAKGLGLNGKQVFCLADKICLD